MVIMVLRGFFSASESVLPHDWLARPGKVRYEGNGKNGRSSEDS
jgi:hypothetical protein